MGKREERAESGEEERMRAKSASPLPNEYGSANTAEERKRDEASRRPGRPSMPIQTPHAPTKYTLKGRVAIH